MVKTKYLPERLLGEGGTDWFSEELTPFYLKRRYDPRPEPLPAVEVDPIEEAEPKNVQTPAEHLTLLERYIQITEE